MEASHRVLVLGGTGPLGREIVRQAPDRGYTVTAVSRHPDRLAVRHFGVTALAGDLAEDPHGSFELFPGHDVVICALGVGKGLRSRNLLGRATPHMLSAMAQSGIRRLVYVSAFGVDGTAPTVPWFFRLMFSTMLADIYADKAVGERAVLASQAHWTILAPLMLSDGPATGSYRLIEETPRKGPWRVARADVAAAVLNCIDDEDTLYRRFVVAAATGS